MADSWPETLPQCLNVGFSSGMADGLLSYKPDQGPDIRRRRTTANVRPLSGQMRMTRAQLAILRSFIETTLLGGSLPFVFKDPTSGDDVLVRFSDGKMPSWQQISGGVFRVPIELEILP